MTSQVRAIPAAPSAIALMHFSNRLTFETDCSDVFSSLEAGAVDFIQKPIETDILRSKAKVFIDLYRQRMEILSQRNELEASANALRAAGNPHVQLQLYPDARHEVLNESNRDEVTTYIINWLQQALDQPRQCQQPSQESHL